MKGLYFFLLNINGEVKDLVYFLFVYGLFISWIDFFFKNNYIILNLE